MRFVDSDSASLGYRLHWITDKKQEFATTICKMLYVLRETPAVLRFILNPLVPLE